MLIDHRVTHSSRQLKIRQLRYGGYQHRTSHYWPLPFHSSFMYWVKRPISKGSSSEIEINQHNIALIVLNVYAKKMM
jgi:hypothetical protein